MIVGFTGTRRGMTRAQKSEFRYIIAVELKPTVFKHGGAVGSDTEAHEEVVGFLASRDIQIFPASPERMAYWQSRWPDCRVEMWQPPLVRNVHIAHSNHLVACPEQATEVLRSGTWSTIRRARLHKTPITIIAPDGDLIREGTHS